MSLNQVKGNMYKYLGPDIPSMVGTWNPIAGCENQCAYCVEPKTPILMSDLTWKPISQLSVGEEIIGLAKSDDLSRNRWKYTRTVVIEKESRIAPAIELTFDDRSVICSKDHRWLTPGSRWHSTDRLCLKWKLQAPFSTPVLVSETEMYKLGYLSGIIQGDGHLGIYQFTSKEGYKHNNHLFRLAMKDSPAINRTEVYLRSFGVETSRFVFNNGKHVNLDAIRTSTRDSYFQIKNLIEWREDREFMRGYLSGIFDAEGSAFRKKGSVVRIFNKDESILARVRHALDAYNFSYNQTCRTQCKMITLAGGASEYVRFFSLVDRAIKRKASIEGNAMHGVMDLKSIHMVDKPIELWDIQTETGNFIANGLVSHNCYLQYGRGKLNMTPRFRPNYLKDDLYKHGKGTIFVGSVADWGCPEVEMEWIQEVLTHCHKFSENTFLFQSKIPDVFLQLLHPEFRPGFPKNTILATTMETNYSGVRYRELTGCKAKQMPWERMFSMRAIGSKFTKMITVEPIVACSPVALSNYIAYSKVDIVTIGGNSYYNVCPLDEPSSDDIEELVRRLSQNGHIKAIILKSNLKRLLDGKVLDYPKVHDMSKKKKGDGGLTGRGVPFGWDDAVSMPRGWLIG